MNSFPFATLLPDLQQLIVSQYLDPLARALLPLTCRHFLQHYDHFMKCIRCLREMAVDVASVAVWRYLLPLDSHVQEDFSRDRWVRMFDSICDNIADERENFIES